MTDHGTGAVDLAIADTSLFVTLGGAGPSDPAPQWAAVSVITVGELRLGVLAATSGPVRVERMEALSRAEALEPLPIDAAVTHAWAALCLALREAGRQMPVNDSWIAATALAHHLPVASRDGDYDDVPGLDVIRI